MIKIGTRKIGINEPCFITVDAGLNHNGHIEIAKQLVDMAVKAECDAVKFQTFKRTKKDFPDLSMEMYKKYRDYPNLSYDEFVELKKYCDTKNIMFLSTPFSISAIDFLAPHVPAYKIASPSLTNDYFVRRIKSKRLPIIASTGSITTQSKRATEEEVDHFLSIMNHNKNLALLYCVSEYPCYNFDDRAFLDFINKYDGYSVGFSCHSKDIGFSLYAVELGACIIEQHITLDDNFKCPDSKVSLNPQELEELVAGIRFFEGGKN